jgi:hypothetical protein
MARRCGRSRRGTHLITEVPYQRRRTLTFLAPLRCDRIKAPCIIDCRSYPVWSNLVLTSASVYHLAGQLRVMRGLPCLSHLLGQAVSAGLHLAHQS